MAEKQLHMIRPHLDDLPEMVIPEGYTLRTYQPGDEAAWCEIMDTGVGSNWTVEECRAQITDQDIFLPDGLFFITCNEEPVASACVWPNAMYGPTSAQVHMVCAKPSHRGKGLGYLVTLALLHYMRDHGYESTYLSTDDFRIPAIKAYLRLGFEPAYIEESHRLRWGAIFSELGQLEQWQSHVVPDPPAYQIRETSGNRSLLIVLDHTQQDAYDRACRTILSAFYHLNIPYRVLDLADAREPAQALMTHQAVVLAQEGIGDSLSETLARQIVKAVCDGIGFISFDHHIDRYPDSLSAILPVASADTKHEAQRVTVPVSDHFIVRTHHPDRRHIFQQPLELMCVEMPENHPTLLETDAQLPALAVGQVGEGRIVQYLISPAVWDIACFGHGAGLDDIFWKSIVWASRKPFVMKAMPRFITMQVQSASGAYDGFDWLRGASARGWTPYVGVLTEEIHTDEWPVMAEMAAANQVVWYPQGMTENRSLYYHHPRSRSYTDDELSAGLTLAAEKFRQHGIPMGQTFFPSHGEYGRNAVASIMASGARYSLSPYLPDETQDSGHLKWEPGPYGHSGFTMDGLLGYPDLFVMAAHPDISNAPYPEFGLTTSRISGISDWAVHTAGIGLDARFYGAILLKEQDIVTLAPGEWELVLDRLDTFVSEAGATKMTQDAVGAYSRSKVQTHLAHAGYDEGADVMQLTLTGTAAVPLHLQIFDDECRERVLAVEAFEDRLEESIKLSEWLTG